MLYDSLDSASDPASRVQSVDRAVDLLKAVAAARGVNASAPALAKECGLNRATAWRILGTLAARDLVRRDSTTGWYSLGPALRDLSVGFARDNLVYAAQPILERLSLETGETSCLGVVDGDRLHYVAEVIPEALPEESWLGEPVQLHASSMGKAFLANLDPRRVASILRREPLVRYTSATITDPDALTSELAEIRRVGYAICRGEREEDSWGVAAPIMSAAREPVAVLCLWGPDTRGGRARFDALGRLTMTAAKTLNGM